MNQEPRTTPLFRPFWLLAGVAVLAAGLYLAMSGASAPDPKPATAPDTEFSAERAFVTLEFLLGEGVPHPVGTPANTAVRERLIGELEGMGLEVEEQAGFGCVEAFGTCGYVVNVMTRIEGVGDGPAIALATHYDSVPAAPGAADAIAPVASLVELARMLSSRPAPTNDVVFLFTDGEEPGLLGAEVFASSHPWADDIGLIANFEARGSRGQSLLFETSPGNSLLVREFAAHAPLPVASSLLYDLYRLLPNNTDFTVFRDYGMPGLNFAFADGVAHYHTPLDNPQMLSPGSLQHTGDNALAFVAAFADFDVADLPDSNSIFLTVFPGSVLQAPASWALPLGVVALLVWVFLAFRLLSTGAVSWGGLGLGAVAVLSGLILAGALAFGVTELLLAVTGSWAPWHAVPIYTRIGVWGAAALGMLLPAVLVARRAGIWGLAVPVWMLWAVMQVALAGALPGASVMILLPLLVATVALGVAGFLEPRAPAALRIGAVLVSVLVTALLWLDMAATMELAVSFLLSPAIGVAIGLALSAFLPLLANRPRAAGPNRWLLVAAGAATVLSVILVLQTPAVTAERPERMNVVHYQLDDEAQWIVDPNVSRDLPEAMAALHDFSRGTEDWLLWYADAHFTAAAPAQVREVVGANVLADELQPDGSRLVRLELASEGEPLRFVLSPVGGAPLREIRWPGGPTIDAGDGSIFSCNGASCVGTEVELVFDTADPAVLHVYELAADLPAGGAQLAAARPETAVPSQDGDITILGVTIELPGL